MTQFGEEVALGDYRTDPATELVLFDVAAACVTYQVPVDGSLEELVRLSATLYDNPRLLSDSRRAWSSCWPRSATPSASQHSATSWRTTSFGLELEGDTDPSALWTDEAQTVARRLRAEPGLLSEQEIADALAQRASYAPDDLAIVDWFAALLIGRGTEDEHAVLELCTVELLSLRLLDAKLDANIETAYELLAAARGWRAWLRPRTVGLERISALQAEAAVLFEGVNNAFKLLGDQYLARLYRVASTRLRLAEWDATIERKPSTLDAIHEKLRTRADTRRLELLEWISVLLIAFDIAIYFFD